MSTTGTNPCAGVFYGICPSLSYEGMRCTSQMADCRLWSSGEGLSGLCKRQHTMQPLEDIDSGPLSVSGERDVGFWCHGRQQTIDRKEVAHKVCFVVC